MEYINAHFWWLFWNKHRKLKLLWSWLYRWKSIYFSMHKRPIPIYNNYKCTIKYDNSSTLRVDGSEGIIVINNILIWNLFDGENCWWIKNYSVSIIIVLFCFIFIRIKCLRSEFTIREDSKINLCVIIKGIKWINLCIRFIFRNTIIRINIKYVIDTK